MIGAKFEKAGSQTAATRQPAATRIKTTGRIMTFGIWRGL
jgi:hypothetical protein